MIKVENLTKYYDEFLAVDGLSFEIGEGHVYGFLGPNGAGKSTTMNIITGCLSPTAGKVTIGGYDILEEPEKAKRLIGYLPEHPPLYLSETPMEYLEFVGEAKGLRGQTLREEIERVVLETGIDKVRYQLISTLSKGYMQRVGIAQALLGSPEVIILDEPTVGLDPIQIIEIRDLIRSLGETHTVIFSSHILSEVQAICDRVLIISKGRLVAFDTPENLEVMMKSTGGFYVLAEASVPEAGEIMESLGFEGHWSARDIGDGASEIRVNTDACSERELGVQIFNAFSERSLPIFAMYAKKANLEDVFIELTGQAASSLSLPQEEAAPRLAEEESASESEDWEVPAEGFAPENEEWVMPEEGFAPEDEMWEMPVDDDPASEPESEVSAE